MLKRHLLAIGLICVVSVMTFWHLLYADFLVNWDDPLYVTANPAVRGFSFDHLKVAFTTFFVGNYAPAQIVSYMLDYELWGMNPFGFHLDNLILHTLNGILFYFVVSCITGNRFWSLLAALIFVVHPVQVESVGWVSQRKNLLAMTFYLSSFLIYISFLKNGRKLFLCFSVLAYFVALLSKSVTVVLPIMLVCYDVCYLGSSAKSKLLNKIPYVLAAGAIAALAMISQNPEISVGRGGGMAGFYYGGSPWTMFLTMIPVMNSYLLMLVLPLKLSAIYDPPIKTGFDGEVLVASLVLAVLAIGMVWLWFRKRSLFFWGACFFLGLLPVSQIVPLVTLMNDRYLYFPMLGFAGLVGGIPFAFPSIQSSRRSIALTGMVLLVVSFFAVLAWQRSAVWKNSVTLWSDATKKVPGSDGAWYMLGQGYQSVGRIDEAESAFKKTLQLIPMHPRALMQLGLLSYQKKNYIESQQYCLAYSRSKPADPGGFTCQGNNYYMMRQFGLAAEAYRRAIALNGDNAEVRLYLGNALLQEKDFAGAAVQYGEALKSRQWQGEAAYALACLEAIQGHNEDAIAKMEFAFSAGFRDLKRLRNNSELAALWAYDSFQRLVRSHFPEGR